MPRASVPPRGPARSVSAIRRRVSLCEALDRVLHKGAFIGGDIVISIADVDLLYVGLSLVAASVDTMQEWGESHALRRSPSKA